MDPDLGGIFRSLNKGSEGRHRSLKALEGPTVQMDVKLGNTEFLQVPPPPRAAENYYII
jgi:hypothetical protein